jgi:hypothetical protein
VLAGCGTDVKTPSVPAFPAPGGAHGDTATFLIDGQRVSITQSGTVSVRIDGVPQVSYSGPLGCKGRYFTGHLTEHIEFFFHYSAHGAWLFVNNGALYHFPGPPKRSHGGLTWAKTLGGRHQVVTVGCPMPRSSR